MFELKEKKYLKKNGEDFTKVTSGIKIRILYGYSLRVTIIRLSVINTDFFSKIILSWKRKNNKENCVKKYLVEGWGIKKRILRGYRI